MLMEWGRQARDAAGLEHSAETDLAALGEKEKQLYSLTAASDEKLDPAKKVLAKLMCLLSKNHQRPGRSGSCRPASHATDASATRCSYKPSPHSTTRRPPRPL
jgi:hypothetical protein